MIILKVTKNPWFYLLFRRYIFGKTTGGGIKLTPKAFLGLSVNKVTCNVFNPLTSRVR